MAAAAVFQAKRADVEIRSAVDDRLADHDSGVLLAETPCNVYRKLGFRPHGIHHEAVARIDDLDGSKKTRLIVARECPIDKLSTQKIPEAKKLPDEPQEAGGVDGFMNIPDGIDEEMPFA